MNKTGFLLQKLVHFSFLRPPNFPKLCESRRFLLIHCPPFHHAHLKTLYALPPHRPSYAAATHRFRHHFCHCRSNTASSSSTFFRSEQIEIKLRERED